MRDYRSAVSFFEEATQIIDSVFGVYSDECGDYYLKYGIALFELARLESGILDGVVQAAASKESDADGDEDAEDDEEDDENDEEDDGDAEAEAKTEADTMNGDEKDKEEEKAGSSSSQPQAKVEQGDASTTQCDETVSVKEDVQPGSSQGPSASSSSMAVEEDIEREPVASSSASACQAVAGTSTGITNEEDQKEAAEDAEPSNTEIAWEVLSTAKDIFKRSIEKDGSKVKLADALQTLAEISLEWENFEAASDLFQESLALKKEVLPEGDRSIAESYYHIGITFSFMNEIERANDCFRSAVQVIETKITNLKQTLESSDEASKDAILTEVKELEALLPDMAARIEDSRDQMINSVQVMQAVEEEESRESEAVAKVSPKKPVNNISHLVKRKRPVSPDPAAASASASSSDTPDTSSSAAKKLCS